MITLEFSNANMREFVNRALQDGDTITNIGRQTNISRTALYRFLMQDRSLDSSTLSRLMSYLEVKLVKDLD
jgi:DNA-binding phage protein